MFNDSSDKSFMILQDPRVAQRIDSPFDLELQHEACLDPAKSKQQEPRGAGCLSENERQTAVDLPLWIAGVVYTLRKRAIEQAQPNIIWMEVTPGPSWKDYDGLNTSTKSERTERSEAWTFRAGHAPADGRVTLP